MFPGAFKRRWTLRWAVGRIITALVIALVFLAADYARAAEPTMEGYKAYRPSWGGLKPIGTGASQATACGAFGPAAVEHYSIYASVVNSSYNGDGCDVRLEKTSGTQVDISGVVVVPVMLCEAGTQPIDGECPEECDAGETFDVVLDIGTSSGAYKTWIAPDGCFYERVGVSACLLGVDSADDPAGQCSFTYRATGEKVGGNATTPPDSDITTIDVSSMNTPTKRNQSEGAPNTTELSDGTTITTQTTVDTTTGGGSADLATGDGTYTFNVVKNSNSTTTTTVTTTRLPDGTTTQETTTSNNWTNGDTLGANVTSNGTVTVATTEGASGGGAETTTTTTNPDGSSTTETTSNGDAGAGAVCESGECEDTGTDGDGEGEGEGEGAPGEYSGDGAPQLDDIETVEGSLTSYWQRLKDVPILQPLTGLGDGISTAAPCPQWSFSVMESDFTIDYQCRIAEDWKVQLGAVFMVLWTIAAVRVLFTA